MESTATEIVTVIPSLERSLDRGMVVCWEKARLAMGFDNFYGIGARSPTDVNKRLEVMS
jgi:hypothetical protein